MARSGLALVARCGVAALAAASLSASSPQLRSSVDVVPVHVTVRNRDGTFLRNLTREDFELLDNGQRREITVFSADLQPTAVAIVLDRSGSVAPRRRPQRPLLRGATSARRSTVLAPVSFPRTEPRASRQAAAS